MQISLFYNIFEKICIFFAEPAKKGKNLAFREKKYNFTKTFLLVLHEIRRESSTYLPAMHQAE